MGRKKLAHYECKCGKPARRNRAGKCNDCHNAYQRANRKKHSELTGDQRKRANARSYVHVYIKRGKLKKEPCVICGKEKVEAHHDDYDKPLQVKWLCHEHHLEYHKNKTDY